MWGLLEDSRSIIDVVGAVNRRNRRGIVIHRVRRLHPDDCAEIDGIPVTSVARTLLDIAEAVPRRKLVYALEQAEKNRLFDMRELEACMRRPGPARARSARSPLSPPGARAAAPSRKDRRRDLVLGLAGYRTLPGDSEDAERRLALTAGGAQRAAIARSDCLSDLLVAITAVGS
jgi:hypothetical protein